MNIVWTSLILILLCSLIFLYANLGRARRLTKLFRLNESRYTLLFSIIGLKHILTLYVAFVLIYTVGSVYLILYLSAL